MVEPLLARNRNNLLLAGAFVVFASVAALQIMAAHGMHPIAMTLLYAAALAAVSFAFLFRPLPAWVVRSLADRWIWVPVLCAMMAADTLHYAHKLTMPYPMTTGMAITEPGIAMLHGRDPYGVELPQGAPISPGPGWILLLLPLSAAHAIGLLDGLALLVAAAVLGRSSRTAGGLLVALVLLQPMFLSEAANAQDLFVISLALATLCSLLGTVELTRLNLLLLGTISGFVATSRVPMVLFFGVLVAGVWKRERRAAMLYAATTLGVCAALHGGFLLWARHSGDVYQPLHVFGRASSGGPIGPVLASLLLLVAAAGAWRFLDARPTSWMLACWLTMTALFAPIGLRELGLAHFDWRWEGDNYIAFPLPLLAAAIALRAGGYTISGRGEDPGAGHTT